MHHDTRQPPRRISASDMYPTPYYDEFAREAEDEMLERHLCFLWSQREGAEEDLPRKIYLREGAIERACPLRGWGPNMNVIATSTQHFLHKHTTPKTTNRYM